MIRENFLTIPCAPNYEINSQLLCRSKITGQLLKLQVVPHRRGYYSLRDKSHPYTIKRSPATLRAQALDATNPQNTFEPIPSLGGKYEINIRGTVRNSFSKLSIKPFEGHVSLYDGKKYVRRSVKDLRWEVHGIEHQPRFSPCPCFAENQHGKRYFPTLKACAKFIAPLVKRSAVAVAGRLSRREPNVFGYGITYLRGKEYSS